MTEWTIYDNKIPYGLLSYTRQCELRGWHENGGMIEMLTRDCVFAPRVRPNWAVANVYRAVPRKSAQPVFNGQPGVMGT